MLRFSGLYQENCSDLYVTCQVFAEGKPLALPVRTSYKAFSTRWKWVPVLSLSVCSQSVNLHVYLLYSLNIFWPIESHFLSFILCIFHNLELKKKANLLSPRFRKVTFSCSDFYFCLLTLSIFSSLCSLSGCPVQLERVAAAASQVPRPSPKCSGRSHSVGHLWTWQSCTRGGHHCHSIWQIWVSLPLQYYLWLCYRCSVLKDQLWLHLTAAKIFMQTCAKTPICSFETPPPELF